MTQTQRLRKFVTRQGFRSGMAVGTIVALVGSLGAPYKW
jgi:hypothetical protein